MVRETMRFGGWLQLGGILEVLTYETDPLVISAVGVSVARVGTTASGNASRAMTTYFSFLAQSSILAAISAAYAAKEGLVAMRRMYTRANRLVVLTGCLIGGAAAWDGARDHRGVARASLRLRRRRDLSGRRSPSDRPSAPRRRPR